MQPVLVMPFNDTEGIVWRSFQPIVPMLKQVFEAAYVGIPADAALVQPEIAELLRQDPFFVVMETPEGQTAGDYFRSVYAGAARVFPAEQVLHLAFPDRIAFALGCDFREAFLEDVRRLDAAHTPLIFSRSRRAWETHPDNYARVEQMITDTGEMLFGKRLDFAWCHLTVKAGRLGQILPRLTRRDMSLLAEMVVRLLEDVRMWEVDWLAWEDPFILGKDWATLKAERENSPVESRRRLGYAVPMMEALLRG